MEAAKDILKQLGIDSVEEMEINENHTIEVEGYEDLTIEKVGSNRVSVAHHYVQRGDLMCDPEIVFHVEDTEWTPIEYTQHPVISEQNGAGLDIDAFVKSWSDNIRKKGYVMAVDE